ncbi:putative RNA polymerase beta prime subunit [Ralstonia phage RP31]|uniref:Putative RNA polymerase beta prime subunit n=2 Tax=Ripduovirus RP12 TaxID=2560700 RepID=A0A1L7N176_9CAUD|nr:RNA polymerase beta subunit [Ralstonia phage RP12]BAW19232.1 putative RNA polymerase beta prime subunit [Ralstonia phage RP12]BAW19518.1 putative RNA polymerase beta prime subunit [Ralstonia phage RP31]
MNKREFYLKALASEAYLVTAWNIACFSLIAEGPEDWKAKPYPYRLVQLPNAHYFVDPEDTTKLVLIEDSTPGKPLFVRNELVQLEPGDMPNVFAPITTTYGNVLANQIMLVRPFGGKIGFMTGRISTKKIEKIIEMRLQDRPAAELVDGNQPEPDLALAPIYVDEYQRYCDGAFSLVAYTQLFTPADTRKTMTPPPGIKQLRDMLVKQNAGHLHDRAVVAEIAEKLQKVDADYLKGDRGEDFLTSDKSRKIVRSRLFLMYGAETGIEEKVDVDLIERSLTEGWDVNKFPTMNNALRAGSFNRGKQTELGGEAVKDLFRASGNLKISSPDCGSTVGLPSFFTEQDAERIIGFSVIEEGGPTKITHDNVGKYLGKAISLRSPMTCKNSHTDYCAVCLGDRLANTPTGLSMAVADYGSAFLAIYMSAAHSKGIQVARLNIKDQLM